MIALSHHHAPVVYFIGGGDAADRVKIGHTVCVRKRLHVLRRDNGLTQLHLLAWLPGYIELEGRFHAKFYATHLGNEWFRATHAMLDDIEAIRAGKFCVQSLPVGTNPIRSASARRSWSRRRTQRAA